jgi:hypothetical protein
MMGERYFDGHWYFDMAYDAWRFVKAGYYEEAAFPPDEAFEHTIRQQEIFMLIDALDKAGWIKPRLDERLRNEDLKITHRLLDIIEKQV